MLFGVFQARNWKKTRRLTTDARVRRGALRRGICAPDAGRATGAGGWWLDGTHQQKKIAPIEKKVLILFCSSKKSRTFVV